MARRVATLIAGILAAAFLAGCAGQPDGSTGMGGHGMGGPSMTGSMDGSHSLLDRAVAGLPASKPSEEVRLADGASYQLEAAPVTHDPGAGKPIQMWAYNGMLPGPTLRVPQGARITVNLHNNLPMETTIHWHGLRVPAGSDGVPGISQAPIQPGASFTYMVDTPDEGIFWYHPHMRDDIQQELGLYGAVIVEGPDAAQSPREIVAFLDDILLQNGDVVPFWLDAANHVLTGRYGNQYLINLDPDWQTATTPGERVRLYLVGTSIARPFNVTFPGAATVELIGLDAGYLTAPRAMDSLILAQGERAIVDVVMPQQGQVTIQHNLPDAEKAMGRLTVDATKPAEIPAPAPLGPHERARLSLLPAQAASRGPIQRTWQLDVEMTMGDGMGMGGMDMGGSMQMGSEGIEWNPDPFDAMNAQATPEHVTWIIRDKATGRENTAIQDRFPEGSYLRLRIENLASSMHPMQHPIHFHGQRFLVNAVDAEAVDDQVWKDVVLVPAGSTVDLTVEMSNPGEWVAHCHILEHAEAGMVATFGVV